MTTTVPSRDSRAAQRLVEGFSLEMTGKDVPRLMDARRSIPPGTRIHVTFLGNEDLEMRVSAAKAVVDLGFTPVPHISARRLRSRGELEEFLGCLQAVGASDRVFAVGGDPAEPEGPYADALSLIRTGLFPAYGVREVSIAGYPEGHPHIGLEVLWQHLEDKSAALADLGLESTVVTQFGFDTAPVIAWIQEARGRGVGGPVRIGTPGPAGIKRLLGFARRFGISANAMVVKKYGFSLGNLLGTAGPERFVTDLSALLEKDSSLGDVGLHFYTFGGLQATSDWVRDYAAGQG